MDATTTVQRKVKMVVEVTPEQAEAVKGLVGESQVVAVVSTTPTFTNPDTYWRGGKSDTSTIQAIHQDNKQADSLPTTTSESCRMDIDDPQRLQRSGESESSSQRRGKDEQEETNRNKTAREDKSSFEWNDRANASSTSSLSGDSINDEVKMSSGKGSLGNNSPRFPSTSSNTGHQTTPSSFSSAEERQIVVKTAKLFMNDVEKLEAAGGSSSVHRDLSLKGEASKEYHQDDASPLPRGSCCSSSKERDTHRSGGDFGGGKHPEFGYQHSYGGVGGASRHHDHYPQQQQQQQQQWGVLKIVAEIKHPDGIGRQPIPGFGWTDNTPYTDLTRASGRSSSSSSYHLNHIKSTPEYNSSKSPYRSSSAPEETADGWIVTPTTPVGGGGGGRGGGGGGGGGGHGGPKRNYEDKSYSYSSSSSYQSQSSPNTTWSWQDNGHWIPFDSKVNAALEEAYQKKMYEKNYHISGNQYCVDFKEMKQYRINRGTRDYKKYRHVKRESQSLWGYVKEGLKWSK